MKKQTRMRLGLMLLVLALVVGITGYADQEAEAWCRSYGNCETCAVLEEACLAGTVYTYCAGDPTCCANRAALCYDCCIWY